MFGTKVKDEVKYSISAEQEQQLLETIHDFNNNGQPLGWSQTASHNMNSPDYLRGVADTMPNGIRLHAIADLLENVNDLLLMGINVEEPEG